MGIIYKNTLKIKYTLNKKRLKARINDKKALMASIINI